ncbi:C4-dicarboxylate ABC transporter [Synergistales bacterium]|nr:C4-dicarboxylate ABC transporter [Synergistales bacterium]
MCKRVKCMLLAVLLVCVVTGIAGAAPKYKWSFAQPWSRPLADKGYQLFIDKVKEYTNGDIEITLHSNGLLGTHDESLHSVRDGSTEIGTFSPYVNLVPGGMMNWMPWTVSTFDEARIAYAWPNGVLFKVMQVAWREINAELLFSCSQGSYGLGNNVRALKQPEDLKNLKMRVSSSMASVRTLGNMGAGTGMSMETIPWAEIYNALSRGVVDGCWDMWPSLIDERHAEILKYYTDLQFSWDANNVVMNKDLWDSLDPKYQEAIYKAGLEAEQYLDDLYEAEEKEYIKKIQANYPGLTLTFLTPEEKAVWREKANMSAVWAEICDPWLEKVWPGQKMGEKIRSELDAVREQALAKKK